MPILITAWWIWVILWSETWWINVETGFSVCRFYGNEHKQWNRGSTQSPEGGGSVPHHKERQSGAGLLHGQQHRPPAENPLYWTREGWENTSHTVCRKIFVPVLFTGMPLLQSLSAGELKIGQILNVPNNQSLSTTCLGEFKAGRNCLQV